MDLGTAVTTNLGLILFTAISVGLGLYLLYYMIRPQRF